MRRKFNRRLLVSSWNPDKNDKFEQKKKKKNTGDWLSEEEMALTWDDYVSVQPKLKRVEIKNDRPFNAWFRRWYLKLNIPHDLLAARCQCSLTTIYSWLYKGGQPSARKLLFIIYIISLSSGKSPDRIFMDLFTSWRSDGKKI